MRQRARSPAAMMVGHFVMGATLGASGALALVFMDSSPVFAMLANAAASETSIGLFVGTTAVLFGVGATLSGFLFSVIEQSRMEDFRDRR